MTTADQIQSILNSKFAEFKSDFESKLAVVQQENGALKDELKAAHGRVNDLTTLVGIANNAGSSLTDMEIQNLKKSGESAVEAAVERKIPTPILDSSLAPRYKILERLFTKVGTGLQYLEVEAGKEKPELVSMEHLAIVRNHIAIGMRLMECYMTGFLVSPKEGKESTRWKIPHHYYEGIERSLLSPPPPDWKLDSMEFKINKEKAEEARTAAAAGMHGGGTGGGRGGNRDNKGPNGGGRGGQGQGFPTRDNGSGKRQRQDFSQEQQGGSAQNPKGSGGNFTLRF